MEWNFIFVTKSLDYGRSTSDRTHHLPGGSSPIDHNILLKEGNIKGYPQHADRIKERTTAVFLAKSG
jgi:hypothetical protein